MEMKNSTTLLLLAFAFCLISTIDGRVTKLNNALAGQQFVYRPQAEQFIQKCEIKGKPLDMMIIVDSSGSVQEQWPQVLQVLKSVIRYVTIAPDGSATRVSMLIYANNVRKIFDFNTFFRREDMLKAIDAVRPINGVTNTGNALNKSRLYWTEERGMRGAQVPKFLFLFSDGRASDFPLDTESALVLREQLGIPIYVYGYGEHLDWNPLREIVGGDAKSIVNSRNATKMFDWIAPWKGIEICEEVPVCVPGAHRPVDILFILDVSSSVEGNFNETKNLVLRFMNFINVNPDAARVALVMYSNQPQLVFDFNEFKNTNDVTDRLLNLQGPKLRGITGTTQALQMANELFGDAFGARDIETVPRVAIILTDGYATSNPAVHARRLRGLKEVDILAVGLKAEDVDLSELRELVGQEHTERIFISGINLISLNDYVKEFYTDRTCPGIELIGGNDLNQDDAVKVELRPIEAKCTAQGIFITVRTTNGFDGTLFTLDHDQDVSCVEKGQGLKETPLILKRGSCGVEIQETTNGYKFTAQLGVRFHEFASVDGDEAQQVECEVFEKYVPDLIDKDIKTNVGQYDANVATCQYNVHSNEKSGCEIFDAVVGSIVEHEWKCNMGETYSTFLVHDCIAQGETTNEKPLYLLSNEGCETDAVLLSTPKYPSGNFTQISQRESFFKLPHSTSIQFQCLISICDMDGVRECRYMFSRLGKESPLACKNEGPLYRAPRLLTVPIDYDNPPQNDQFERVLSVASRVINVYEQPKMTVDKLAPNRKYCTSLFKG